MTYCPVSADCDREARWFDLTEQQEGDARDEANRLLDRDPAEFDRLVADAGLSDADDELQFEHVMRVMHQRLFGRF